MFLDSEVIFKFRIGKTKTRYTFTYGIAPVFKNQLIYNVKSSLFNTFPDDENLNLQMHICKMEVGVRFRDEEKKMVETRFLDSGKLFSDNFSRKCAWWLLTQYAVHRALKRGTNKSEWGINYLL